MIPVHLLIKTFRRATLLIFYLVLIIIFLEVQHRYRITLDLMIEKN